MLSFATVLEHGVLKRYEMAVERFSMMKIRAKGVSILCFLAGSAFAANFPDADGSHDIASLAAWGGTLPGESEEVAFTNQSSVTIYAKNDVTFGQLVNKLAEKTTTR